MTISQGWEGHVGFGTQGDLLVEAAPTIFQEVQPDVGIAEVEPDKSAIQGGIRGSQDFVATRRGKKSTEGTSGTGHIWPNDFYHSKIWATALGNNNAVSGDATVGFTHTFSEPASTADFPINGETIEVFKGGAASTTNWRYLASFLSALTLAVPENDLVTMAPEWLGIKESTGSAKGTPSFSTTRPFESFQVQVNVGATIAAATKIKFTDLTIAGDLKVLLTPDGCSQFPTNRVFGKPEWTIQFNQIFEDDLTLYNNWKNNDELALQIEIVSDALAGSVSGLHSITINFPRVTFLGDTPNLTAIENFPHPVSLMALTDPAAGHKIEVITVDSVPGVYTV